VQIEGRDIPRPAGDPIAHNAIERALSLARAFSAEVDNGSAQKMRPAQQI
jgi:hypothetical protein